MKIGICTGLPSVENQGPDIIGLAEELGYDYIELPLSPLAEAGEDIYEYVGRRLAVSKLRCECMNLFFPERVRLTGDAVDYGVVETYVERALSRAAGVGADVVVFGSSRARNVPDGFPHEKAYGQLARTLQITSRAAVKHGVRVAIEPLNSGESNIILSLGDADKLLTAAESPPGIYILLDFYHYMLESDSIDTLKRLARDGKIVHTHIADHVSRGYPMSDKPEYAEVFGALRADGYDARCSVEARFENPEDPRAEMAAGLSLLRWLFK